MGDRQRGTLQDRSSGDSPDAGEDEGQELLAYTGHFPKSGKYRTYGKRNLEECVND